MVLDYSDYYTVSTLNISVGYSYMGSYRRKFSKDEFSNQKILSYNIFRVQNSKNKKVEKSIMFHLQDSLLFLSLESRDFKHQIQRTLKERNIVCNKDNTAIYLWDDNGDCIEKLKECFDPNTSNYLLRVYEADEDIRQAKLTIIDEIEYLFVIDEQKHCKILKNEDNRSVVYKNYFVDNNFGLYPDVINFQSYSFCKEMLYSNNGVMILQEKGNEKEYCFSYLNYSNMYFDYSKSYFPLCTEGFILYALSPEYNADYTNQVYNLLLAPPMNQYSIRQRDLNDNTSEFFLFFDDKYILESSLQNDEICIKVYSLNGEILQTSKTYVGYYRSSLVVSQSGEYIAIVQQIPPEEQDIKFIPKKIEENMYSGITGVDPASAPTVKLFRIRKTEEYKKFQSSMDNAGVVQNNNDSSKLKEIIKLDQVKKYDIPHDCLVQGYYGEDTEFIYGVYNYELKEKLHVDNKGNVLLINPQRKLFLINGNNEWNTFNDFMTKYRFENYDSLEIFKFGQELVVLKKDENIFKIRYDSISSKLNDGDLIGHEAVNTKRCKLTKIIPTKLNNIILLFYQQEGNAITVVAWDIDEDNEHASFSSRPDDVFKDYFTDKTSKLGFISFNNYIVDLDNCIPNPFIRKSTGIYEKHWLQGMKANFTQDMFIGNGVLRSPVCFKDIYYSKNRSLQNLDLQKVNYYMDRKSVVFDYLEEHESLSKILSIFEKLPLYYAMILIPNNDKKTALEVAIENNSTKVVEVLLNSLIKLGDFSLSNMIYKQFSDLFKMKLVAFASYLNTCYFSTGQMLSMNKLRLPPGVDSIREYTKSCILDKDFYKRYGIDESKVKVKANAILPSDNLNNDQKDNEGDDLLEENLLKRVTIKGIEFGWIFSSQEGADFLQELSETENIRIFEHDIIKDIVLFQWSYFKIHIILKLLIPYLIYFLIFVLHVTFIIKNEYAESKGENRPFHISAWVFGSVILIFNVFWAYVEFTQMMFHKSVYFKSFWNLLDLSSVVLNTAVVIMEFSTADFAQINRVSSVSVLILYFKIFYFLRIFFETGYLVRMIIEIVKDMRNFVLILLISVFAFANSYYILGRNSGSTNFAGENVAGAFIFSWNMAIGNSDTSGFGTRDEVILWIIYVINLIINLVMLLNLVVAIMGDTFDKVQKTQEYSMLQELSQVIRENEFLFSRKRVFKKAKYILVIEPEKAEDVGLTSWDGKINQIKTFIEDSANEHMKQLKRLQNNIEDIATDALNEKLQPIEDRINQKLLNCDKKMQNIQESTENLINYFEKYVKNLENGKNKK